MVVKESGIIVSVPSAIRRVPRYEISCPSES